ncbi:hypothetical protein [Clostridium baratii]|uniref:hypothetical protein n=1 Tax=Clostridium baratii TaxID=1561 RepID=UPI003D7B5290
MKQLRKEKYFNYDLKDILGIMRIDFYNGELANKWNPKNLKNIKKVNIRKLQQEMNYIQFDLLNNYSEVIELCGGNGYEKETLLYIDLEIGKYVIKLIPVLDSYSYIYAYIRNL